MSKWNLVKSIPIIFGISFTIFGLIARQYAFIFLALFSFIGFPIIYLILPKINEKHRHLWTLLLVVPLVIATILFGFLARGTLPPNYASQVWVMHQIDNPGLPIPNGLDPADVDKDGYLDYVTNYEWDGYLRIAFYPGPDKVNESWPTITVGKIDNAENAAFGDFDGDGNVDIVVAHGGELFAHSGVLFIWGPDSSNVRNASAWKQSGDINGTENAGQFHCVRGHDVNGDGIDDVVVGGRGINPRAGLKWIESPANAIDRRDLTKWKIYNIDPNLESGHGFEFGDLDLDGDEDIVLCNSDWDTLDSEEKILYYENPGVGHPSQRETWTKHIIYQGSEFYSKEQVSLYDLSGDGYLDVIMQVEEYIYWFKNPGNKHDPWTLIKISKAQEARGRARPIKIGDIDGDGRPDILGMLIHYEGFLPADKAAVFWMSYSGSNPESAEWKTNIIKWADGFIGIGTYNGEKWDQCIFEDVDRDGDMDIVANCEEYHTLGFVFFAVVWFENPSL